LGRETGVLVCPKWPNRSDLPHSRDRNTTYRT